MTSDAERLQRKDDLTSQDVVGSSNDGTVQSSSTASDNLDQKQMADQQQSSRCPAGNESPSTPKKRKSPTTLDPYHGFDQPKKKKRGSKTQPPTTYHGEIVSYTQKTMPRDLIKYYRQRHSYFSKYNKGILMDREGWFSVTPESIAEHIAQRCRGDVVVIDAFCGCGGNTIQFALACKQVIAIDIDPVKLHCARHNAKIYGVEDRIEFIQGSFFDLAPYLKADIVFLSPPWGGPAYLHEDMYDLKTMMPGNGKKIFKLAQQITRNVIMFMPRNTDPNQLALLAGKGQCCEIERNYLAGNLKALTVYYGDNLPNWQALDELMAEEQE